MNGKMLCGREIGEDVEWTVPHEPISTVGYTILLLKEVPPFNNDKEQWRFFHPNAERRSYLPSPYRLRKRDKVKELLRYTSWVILIKDQSRGTFMGSLSARQGGIVNCCYVCMLSGWMNSWAVFRSFALLENSFYVFLFKHHLIFRHKLLFLSQLISKKLVNVCHPRAYCVEGRIIFIRRGREL